MFCKTHLDTQRFRESNALSMAVAIFCSVALHVVLFLSWSMESRSAAEQRTVPREHLPSIRFSVALLPSENVAIAPLAKPPVAIADAANEVSTTQVPQLGIAQVQPLPLPPMQEASRETVEQTPNGLSEALPEHAAPNRSAGPFLRHRLQRDLKPSPAYRPELGLDNRPEMSAPQRMPTP